MEIKKYPDGSSYVVERNPSGFQTFKLNCYEDLWHLNQFVDAYNNFNKGGMIPTITIPNLIDAQADRRFNIGESSGLKLVCDFLNRMNADFKIFHPHNAEVVEALIDNVKIINNFGFIVDVLSNIRSNDKGIYPCIMEDTFIGEPGFYRDSRIDENLILMSSDAGGFKPLMKLCDKIKWQGETYSASKSRSYVDGHSKLVQLVTRLDFEKKDILIVDDICVYGGTFKGLSKLLRARNCGKLYLAVSHMTVQNLGQDNVCGYFDKVFTTNSKFDEYFCSPDETPSFEEPQPKNLEIIKLF